MNAGAIEVGRSGRASRIDPAMEKTLKAVALSGMSRPSAAHLRRVLMARHGDAPHVSTIRRWLARWQKQTPPRAAFAGSGTVGFVRSAR